MDPGGSTVLVTNCFTCPCLRSGWTKSRRLSDGGHELHIQFSAVAFSAHIRVTLVIACPRCRSYRRMIGLGAFMICARDVTMSRWLRRIRAEAKRGWLHALKGLYVYRPSSSRISLETTFSFQSFKINKPDFHRTPPGLAYGKAPTGSA